MITRCSGKYLYSVAPIYMCLNITDYADYVSMLHGTLFCINDNVSYDIRSYSCHIL